MTKDELKDYLLATYASDLTFLESGKYNNLFEIPTEKLLTICQTFRDDEKLGFNYLCCVSGIDNTENLAVVYSLYSIENKHRVDLKVILPYEGAEVESIQTVWPAANWYERELWELYGINIKNHDNLTQFLLPDDWDQGFPMRKDWDAPDFIRMPEL